MNEDYSVLGYARVSTKMEGQDGSIEGQLRQLTEAGCTYVIKERASAYKESVRRRGWEELQSLVASGQVRKVVAISYARLSRQSETKKFLKICARLGVKTQFLDGTPGDIADPGAMLLAGVMDSVNEVDSMIKAINIKNGIERKRKAGDYACGSVPFGYKYVSPDVIPHPQKFAAARELWDLLAENEYNSTNVIKVYGYKWTPEGMRRWMHNPVLRGTLPKNLGSTVPLITEAEYLEAKNLLDSRRNSYARAGSVTRLFSRAVKCKCCDRWMNYAKQKNGFYLQSIANKFCDFYGRGIQASRVRDQFIEALRENVDLACDVVNAAPTVKAIDPEQIEAENQLNNLLTLQANGVPELEDAIEALRLRSVRIDQPLRGPDWQGYRDIILKPGALESLSDEKLRILLLEFASDIFYIGNPQRVEIRLSNG